MELTRRERLRRCYFHEELDRPAVYSRTGFPRNDPTYDELKAYLREHSELKDHSLNVQSLLSPLPIESHTEPYSEDFERGVRVLHTPKGDLRASHLVSLKGLPGLHKEFFINTKQDAEKYMSLPVPEIGGEVSRFFEAERETGDRGIVEAHIGSNPGGAAAVLCGSENFALMSVTDRDVIHALCERRMRVLLQLVKFLVEKGIGPYFAMSGEEYIVPPLHGPRDFHDFNFKYNKPIVNLVHEAGGRMHIHCHGSIKTVFGDFLDMGVDVLHPFEAPPMGDITPAEAKEMAGRRLTLEGNIQIDHMYDHTPGEIREETNALIESAFGDHTGLIVCPSASPYVRGKGLDCLPQYKAMVETVLAWEG